MQPEGAFHVNRAFVNARNCFAILTPKLGIAPAGQMKAIRILGQELEGDLALDGKRFTAFGQSLGVFFVQIVVVRMEGMLEGIQGIVVVEANSAEVRAEAEIAVAAHKNWIP